MSISADLHLAKTLDALKSNEDGQRKLLAENQELKAELHQEKNAAKLLLDENAQLKSAQQKLCGKVDDLKRENVELQEKLQQCKVGGGCEAGGTSTGEGERQSGCQRCAKIDRELARLKSANDEVRTSMCSDQV